MTGSNYPFIPLIIAMFRYLLAFVKSPAAYLGFIENALQRTFNRNSRQVTVSEGLVCILISPISIAPSP
jgi:hypothetical protein